LLYNIEVGYLANDGSSRVALPTPPGPGSEFGILELDPVGALERTFSNPSPNLIRADTRGEGLVFGAVGALSLIAEGVVLLPPETDSPNLQISGIAPYGWSFRAVMPSGGTIPKPGRLVFGVGTRDGIAIAGHETFGALEVNENPAWNVPTGTGFIALVNSERGRVCADR